MHYYQHHIGDFIKATARLSDSQSMAYLRLIWMYYDSEKPLTLDTKVLAFQIGASVEDTELLLKSFFALENDGWHQTRCDKEIEDYREFLNKKINAGKASAERRKNNSSTGVQQVFNNSSTDVQLTTNQQPLTTNHKPKKEKTEAIRPIDISESVWDDFIAIRNKVKKPFTETALKIIQREAQKAGFTLEQALETCCARGWQGFEAAWVQKDSDLSKTGQMNQRVISGLTRGLIGGGGNVKLLGN